MFGCWFLLVNFCCWLSVVGRWWVLVGYWLFFVVGVWLFVVGVWWLVAGFWWFVVSFCSWYLISIRLLEVCGLLLLVAGCCLFDISGFLLLRLVSGT